MGVRSILGGFALLCCAIGNATHATVLTGNTVQTISGPESQVFAYDQAMVELVTGANVGSMYMNAQSRLNVSDGLAAWIYMYDDSRAAIDGGVLSWLQLYGRSNADITNGTLSWLQMFEASTANIFKAELSWLVFETTSRADIYGRNFAYSGGHLSGNWADGTPFSFWAVGRNAQRLPIISAQLPGNIVLHTIPMPGTAYLFLLALPLLAMFRGRRRVNATALV